MDHAFESIELLVVDVDVLERASNAGQETKQLLHRPHAAQRLHLREEVVHGELALREFRGHFLGFFVADFFACLLDECDHIAHAEDAARHALRAELIERIELLAGSEELDRCARHFAHGERCAAARVAVEFREDDAVDRKTIVKSLRAAHGVLSGHRIDDEQNLVRLHGHAHALEFLHKLVVDVQTACRVENHDIEAFRARLLHRAATDANRGVHGLAVFGALVGFTIELDLRTALRICGDAFDHLLKLLNSSGALQIGGSDKA